MRNATIRVQTLFTGWETVGIDRMSGIVAENVKYSADAGGSSSASFDLKRDPAVVWPDIAAFAPIEIEVDGVLVWSGRIKETPTRESANETVINVQCEGWQFHLDDDVYSKAFVRTRMSDWQDFRACPDANLSVWTSDLLVQTADSGKITIGAPNGVTWQSGHASGIYLDLGPNATAKRLVVKGYRTAGTGSSVGIYGRTGPDPPGNLLAAGGNDAFSGFGLGSVSTTAPAGTVLSGTFATPGRYVLIFTYMGGANYGVAASDGNGDVFIITDIQVFTDTLYESGNASILKASDVILDSVSHAPNLSTDTSQISTTSFSIPDFSVVDPQTPRSVQDAVNAFHNYRRYVDVNLRLVFKPQASAAIIEAAAGSVVSVEDASANSGDDIYNKVVLTGQQANGAPLYVERYPGGGAIAQPGGTSSSSLTINLTGTFNAHRTYTLSFHVQRVTNLSTMGYGSFQFGTATDYNLISRPGTIPAGTAFDQTITWTPQNTYASGVQLVVSGTAGGALHNVTVSNNVLSGGGNTLPDLRGFSRAKLLPLSFPTTTVAAQALGDTFLAGHTKTPFKGTVSAKGSNSLLRIVTGEPVPIHLMPLYAGELLRLPDRIDPDTGALGRDGKMAQVDVDLNEDTVTIALDNTRNDFEAFLARLEVVTNRRVQ